MTINIFQIIYKGELQIKEDYFIELTSTQKYGKEKDTVNLQTMGNFVQMGDKKYIVYKEYIGKTQDNFVVNTLKIIGKNCAVLIKNNLKQTRMIFEKNRRHYCPYHTDLGTITFGVFTDLIDFKEKASGGSVHLRYSLDMNAALVSENELNIEFKKVK